MATLTSSGTVYESSATWPKTTKVFNTLAFRHPERRFTDEHQGPHQRSRGYPELGPDSFQIRGKPQLTWFEGTYDIPAFTGTTKGLCRYPSVVVHVGSRALCFDPTRLTPAEQAALAEQRKREEKALTDWIEADSKAEECTRLFRGADGKNYTEQYYYRPRKDGKPGSDVYSCATKKFLYSLDPDIIRGLGSTEYQASAVSKTRRLHLTTEAMLLAAMGLAFFVVRRHR